MVLTDSTVEVDVNWPCRPSHRTGCNSHAALALFTVQAVEKLKKMDRSNFHDPIGDPFHKTCGFLWWHLANLSSLHHVPACSDDARVSSGAPL